MTKTPKRPRDPNQLAKAIVDHATMDEAELKAFREKRGLKAGELVARPKRDLE